MTDSGSGVCDAVFKFHSTHLRVIYKKPFWKYFGKTHRQTFVPEYLFKKVPGLQRATLLKADFDTGVFPLTLRIFRAHFLQNKTEREIYMTIEQGAISKTLYPITYLFHVSKYILT